MSWEQLPLTKNKLKFGGIHKIGGRAGNKKITDKQGYFPVQMLQLYIHHCKEELKKKIIEYNEKKASSCYIKSFSFVEICRRCRPSGNWRCSCTNCVSKEQTICVLMKYWTLIDCLLSFSIFTASLRASSTTSYIYKIEKEDSFKFNKLTKVTKRIKKVLNPDFSDMTV